MVLRVLLSMDNNNSRTASSRIFTGSAADGSDLIDWELRPGGMVVQKRDTNGDPATYLGRLLKVKVSHDLVTHTISLPAHASFGDLKRLLSQETGVQPQEQRIWFKGKVKESGEYLFVAGVRDKAKLVMTEDPTSRERKRQEVRYNEKLKMIAGIEAEVDKLENQLFVLQNKFESEGDVPETDINLLIEKLMMQLLKLDGIEGNVEMKVLYKRQMVRVQKLVEALDELKAKNSTRSASSINSVVVTTSWESFNTAAGKSASPPQALQFPPLMDWERFD